MPTLTVTNTTDSTSISTGALIVNGGVGIAKSLSIGGTLNEALLTGVNILASDVLQVAGIVTVATTVLDSWAIATYRACKYLVYIAQGTNYQVSEVLVVHNGSTTFMAEYAVLETNGTLGTITTDINTGNARLLVTMGTTTSATVNVARTLMVV